jgi:hypothetical protein
MEFGSEAGESLAFRSMVEQHALVTSIRRRPATQPLMRRVAERYRTTVKRPKLLKIVFLEIGHPGRTVTNPVVEDKCDGIVRSLQTKMEAHLVRP